MDGNSDKVITYSVLVEMQICDGADHLGRRQTRLFSIQLCPVYEGLKTIPFCGLWQLTKSMSRLVASLREESLWIVKRAPQVISNPCAPSFILLWIFMEIPGVLL